MCLSASRHWIQANPNLRDTTLEGAPARLTTSLRSCRAFPCFRPAGGLPINHYRFPDSPMPAQTRSTVAFHPFTLIDHRLK